METTNYQEIQAEPIATANLPLAEYQNQCLERQQLVRNFSEYVRRTGDCHFQDLIEKARQVNRSTTTAQSSSDVEILPDPEALPTSPAPEDLEPSTDCSIDPSINPSTDPSTDDSTDASNPISTWETSQKTLQEIEIEIVASSLIFQEILKQLVAKLHPTTPQENLRNLLEEIPDSPQSPYLMTALKTEHHKLAVRLSILLKLAKKLVKQNEEPSLEILVRDLTYFHQYIIYHAQPTKIHHDLSQVCDGFVYLRRLNQYLDLLPAKATALAQALQNILEENLNHLR